jgi:hypothetical protein
LEQTLCYQTSEYLFWSYFEFVKPAVDYDFKCVVFHEFDVFFFNFGKCAVYFITFYEIIINSFYL